MKCPKIRMKIVNEDAIYNIYFNGNYAVIFILAV